MKTSEDGNIVGKADRHTTRRAIDVEVDRRITWRST